jgi:hypothetical protein
MRVEPECSVNVSAVEAKKLQFEPYLALRQRAGSGVPELLSVGQSFTRKIRLRAANSFASKSVAAGAQTLVRQVRLESQKPD